MGSFEPADSVCDQLGAVSKICHQLVGFLLSSAVHKSEFITYSTENGTEIKKVTKKMFKNNERFPLQPLSRFFLFVFFIFGIFFTLLPFLMNSTTIPFPFPAHLSANQHLIKAWGIYRTTQEHIYIGKYIWKQTHTINLNT